MSWAVIIGLIIEIVGPILQDLLKKLLDKWLKDAAKELDPPSASSFEGDLKGLFDQAIRDQPRFRFGRRAIIRRARDVALARKDEMRLVCTGELASLPPLDAGEIDGLHEAVSAMGGELMLAE